MHLAEMTAECREPERPAKLQGGHSLGLYGGQPVFRQLDREPPPPMWLRRKTLGERRANGSPYLGRGSRPKTFLERPMRG